MDDITACTLEFIKDLRSDKFYEKPLPKEGEQGHKIVAAILERALDNPRVMAALANILLHEAVAANHKLILALTPKQAAAPTEGEQKAGESVPEPQSAETPAANAAEEVPSTPEEQTQAEGDPATAESIAA